MKSYKPKDIEPKWQKSWAEAKIYEADLTSDKPKYIAMSMFNYPSGAGIHIGHAMNYTISDVKARFKRQSGYESYHPVGWDAFGLPAENYAIKAGISPQESMAKIIPGYHKQYKAMGWSNDWAKEIATHEPGYYKWTQWIFSQMYRNGLAYQDSRLQWWCEIDNTVLANEQVIDGKCWRHDGPEDPYVQQKEVKQWFFKITDYADELLDAIDDLDWTETVKVAQKNWIGRSKGAEVDFALDFGDEEINARTGQDGKKAHLTVFTTRPDTLFGATFLVLAPEHPWVSLALVHETVIKNQDEVQEYVRAAKLKSELDRQTAKDKTGVLIEGVKAVNPANGEKIPVYIADYVLAGYGTGVIMAVPAHDERDYEFAKKFGLPITQVIESQDAPADNAYEGEGKLINSGEFNGMSSAEARDAIIESLAKKGSAKEKINYKMRDWSVSRQRYWGAPIPIIHCENCGPVLVPDDKLPVELPVVDDFAPTGDGRSALARAANWLKTDCPKCKGPAERETDTLDTYICSSWYMLRYFDPHNTEKSFDTDIVNKWLPVDFYNGADHATAHLLYARFITRFFTKIGLVNNPEPFKRMLYNGKVTNSDGTAFSKSKGNIVDPLEIIESGYGADALRTYLMFSAPLELGARWDPQGVPGTYRFISRAWNLVQEYAVAKDGKLSPEAEKQVRRTTHQMIAKVSEDIEHNRYNTAIAAAMTAVNELFRLKVDNLVIHPAWQEALEALVCCIAPFAPHAAEELWHDLGHKDSVHVDHWPVHDPKYLVSDEIIIVVQVNGKVRANIKVAADADENTIITAAEADDNVKQYLKDGVKKKIYVPGKLVNFVV